MSLFQTISPITPSRQSCLVTLLCVSWVLTTSWVAAQEANGRYLAELQGIQADYCHGLYYPSSQHRPDENRRWDQNDAKQQKISQLSTRGVDRALLDLVREAKSLSDEVSRTNREYVEAVEKAGKQYREKLPDLLLDPPEGPELIRGLIPGLLAETKLETLRRRCRTDEPDFTRRWKIKLAALAANQPALKAFAEDPESCSPLSAYSVPVVKWADQEIGTSPSNPYRLGDLEEPLEFDVEPRPDASWLYYYRFTLPKLTGPQEFVNLQVSSSDGHMHASFSKVVKQKLATSNERANASAGRSDQIQFPLQPGDEYLLTVYHVHKPAFGPQWSNTRAVIRMWRGEDTRLPAKRVSRIINPQQQKQWLEQQRLSEVAARERLNQDTLATFAARPEFDGRYSEEGTVHAFTLRVLQYVPSSKGVTGEIDWPSYRGATRFRGQLVGTNDGLELTFKETDFVPGKASRELLLGGEYRLKPETRDDKLVLRGEVRLQNRVHPLILQTRRVDANSAAPVAPFKPGVSPPMATKVPTAETPSAPTGDLPVVQTVNRPTSALAHKTGEIQVFTGVTSYDGPLGLLFSRDGKNALATGDRLRAWDLGRGTQTLDHDQNAFYAALLPNGTKALFVGGVGSASHAVFQMALKRGAQAPTHLGELTRITALAVSRDSKLAAVSCNPGIVVVFDLVKNRKSLELNIGRDATALAFAESSSTLLTGDTQDGIRIWDLRNEGQLQGRFTGHGKGAVVQSITVSEDGTSVASLSASAGSPDQTGPLTLIVWKKQSLEETHSVSLGDKGVSSRLSPDWKYALVGEHSGDVGVHSVATGECLETLKGHTGKVTSLAFSPCWRFALSASTDETVRLWGLEKTVE